jgi:hypothetical protein
MLRSLVIACPTHIREGSSFDADSMMTSQPSPSVARVAFYSDIEYEIFKAFSGCRVTVTYYLHLVDPAPSQQVPSVVPNLKAFRTSNRYSGTCSSLRNSCRTAELWDLASPTSILLRSTVSWKT